MGIGRGEGLVDEAGDCLDGLGKGAFFFGSPGADKLTAIIGLEAIAVSVHTVALQMGKIDYPAASSGELTPERSE